MANRLVQRTETAYRLDAQLREAVRELRVARFASGLRLLDVARQTGVSVSWLSQLERGLSPAVRMRQLARVGAVLGLRISIKFYPTERRLLDAGQVALLERLHERISPTWRWETEVPMPISRDLRAADARLIGPVSIMVEAFTRLADYQAQVRAATLKRRDLGADRLVLLLGATRANRQALRVAGEVARVAFPVATRPALSALAAGEDPGGDAIVLL